MTAYLDASVIIPKFVQEPNSAEVHAADMRLAYAYIRRFDLALRAPDALHLAMSQRIGAKLVTFDRRLLGAASALGIIADTPQHGSGRPP